MRPTSSTADASASLPNTVSIMVSTVCMEAAYSDHLNFVKQPESELTRLIGIIHNRRMGEAPSKSRVKAIAFRLRQGRAALGLSQAELCRRAGIATNTYNQWEKEKGAPDVWQAIRLVRAFGYTLDWIFEGNVAGLPHGIASKLSQAA